MALNFENIFVPIAAGLAQKMDERLAPVGRLLEAKNAQFNKTGALAKRRGFASLGNAIAGGGTIASARTMFSTGDELCLVSSRRLYSYNTVSANWMDRGPVSPFAGSTTSINRDERSYESGDIGILGSYTMHAAWGVVQIAQPDTSNINIRYSIHLSVKTTAGETVIAPWQLISDIALATKPHAPRVVPATGKLLVFYMVGITGAARTIRRTEWLLSAPTTKPVTLTNHVADAWAPVAGEDGCRTFDAIGLKNGAVAGGYCFAYVQDGTRDIIVSRYAANHTLAFTVTLAGTFGRVAICEAATTEYVYVMAWDDTGGAETIAFYRLNSGNLTTDWGPLTDAALNLAGTEDVLNLSCTEGNDGVWDVVYFAYNYYSTGNYSNLLTKHGFVLSTGGAFSAVSAMYNAVLRSRPWWYANRCYLVITTACLSSSFEAATVIDVNANGNFSDPRPWDIVGLYDPSVGPRVGTKAAAGYQVRTAMVGSGNNVIQPSTGVFRMASVSEAFELLDTTIPPRYASDEVDFDFTLAPAAVGAHRGCGIIGGGMVSWYDGAEVFQLGYATPPVIDIQVTAALSNTAYGSVAPATYSFSAVFERMDMRGIVHRSAPAPFQLDDPGVYDLTVTAPNDTIGNLKVRTTYADNSSRQLGAVFYRAGPDGVMTRANEPAMAVLNSKSAFLTAAFEDVGQAQDTSGNGIGVPLYTNGGVLEAVTPEGARFVTMVGDRVVLAKPYRRDRMQISNSLTPGGPTAPLIAPEFHEDRGFAAPAGETLVAVAPLDSNMIVFTGERIYALAGRGPDAAGRNNDYSGLQPVASDGGCIDQRSVVAWEGGVMYQSRSGICNMSRGLVVERIGADVEDKLAAYPTITSAVVVVAKTQIRFTCLASGGATGIILVFDYKQGQWTHWEIKAAEGGSPLAFVAACAHNGTYYAAQANGALWQESATTWRDNVDVHVPLVVETAWIQAAQPGGWQRVRFVTAQCARKDPHDLTMTLYHDFYATADVANTWTNAVIATFPELPREQVKFHVRRQQCQALKVRVEDVETATTSTGEGFTLAGFTLEAAMQRGTVKTAPAQRN